jgi:ABC-type bacteriocin/lantibiotic exporter with double-glycine peptidase domain
VLTLKRLTYALSGNWHRMIVVLLFGVILNIVLAAVDPIIIKILVDEGLAKQNFRLFTYLALAVLLFAIFVRVGVWAFDLTTQRLKNRVIETLSLKMLRSYYKIAYSKIVESDSGYYMSRIYDEPAKVAQGVVSIWIKLVTQSVTFLAAAAVALYLDWRITLVLSLIVPLLYYLASRFNPKITSASKTENEEEARLREYVAGAVGAYTTVRVFDLQGSVFKRIGGRIDSYLKVLYSRIKTATTFQMASNICLSMSETVVLLAAGYEVVTGHLTIGGLFGFMSAFWKLIGGARNVIALMPELAKLNGYIERLEEFEAVEPDDEVLADDDRIELEQVCFGYNGREILKEFDLSIGDNEKLLIVGPNGSGKSTLAYIMTRLLEPEKGTVKAPDLSRISALLTPFGFIPGTLKDNVDFDNLSEEKQQLFWRLVKELGIEKRVDQFVSQELSEGEKKKAQVIMTLLKDADIYIFDEPLAHVDEESKEKIIEQQLALAEGKALVSIMHGDDRFHPCFERIVPLAKQAEQS